MEVLRSVRESFREPGGKAFGRTNNTVLLRIPSGSTVLSEDQSTILTGCGLDVKQIAYVNSRLRTLAAPARARTREMDIVEAKAKLKCLISLSETAPSLAADLRGILASALVEIEGHIEKDRGPVDLDCKVPSELLKDTLVIVNQACVEAQMLYRRLSKGELSADVVLEFQRSWFSHQDMVSTFRNRKCFSRPAGWTGLRAQVLAGQVYKYGDPVPACKPASGIDLDSAP